MQEQAHSTGDLLPLDAGVLELNDAAAESFLHVTGLSGIEAPGRWTDGPAARLAFVLPAGIQCGIIVKLTFRTFLSRGRLDAQAVTVRANGVEIVTWHIADPTPRTHMIFVGRDIVALRPALELDLSLPDCAAPAALDAGADDRRLGILLSRLSWAPAPEIPPPAAWVWQLGRPVGTESRKTFDARIEQGFWERFITGPHVLDIGFKGSREAKGVVPITPSAIGIDLDYPGYDGRTLPFPDGSQDAVYSSHCLEHIPDYANAIREWYRVTRTGGHIITVVPHAYLYERKMRPPSRWNQDHKRFYTPASLLGEFQLALPANSYRVRYMEDNDRDYVYERSPELHPAGCYEIVLVIQKIDAPGWRFQD